MVEARRVVDIKRPTGASIRISKERDRDWVSRAVWVARSGPHAEAFRYLARDIVRELEEDY